VVEMKYTPGPWAINRRCSTAVCCCPDGQAIASCAVYSDNTRDSEELHAEQEANAHLIAAAPELLEALVRVQNLSAEYDFPLSLVIAMNTAIAKAEGHEPELEPHRFTYTAKSHQSGQCGRCGLPYEDDIHAYRIDAAVCGHVGTFRGSKCRHCGLEVK